MHVSLTARFKARNCRLLRWTRLEKHYLIDNIEQIYVNIASMILLQISCVLGPLTPHKLDLALPVYINHSNAFATRPEGPDFVAFNNLNTQCNRLRLGVGARS